MSVACPGEGGVNGARGACGVSTVCYKVAMITPLMATGLGLLAGAQAWLGLSP